MYIFGENKATPTISSPRVQRWALKLSTYQYNIEYKKGSENCNADALSRLPLPDKPVSTPEPEELNLLINQLEVNGNVDVQRLRQETDRDVVLAKVRHWIKWGWPSEVSDEKYQPYFRRRHELSLTNDCILWGSRVVIPSPSRTAVLDLLHDTHIGICRMKGLARSYTYGGQGWTRTLRTL